MREIAERKSAEDRVQSQLARLELLHRITRATGERQDLQSIFQVVIRTLEDHLPIDFTCVCLGEQAGNILTISNVGIRSEALAMELAPVRDSRIDIGQNGLEPCIRGQLVYEPDIGDSAFPFPQRLARAGLRSFVGAPLLVESKVFGVLIAARRPAHGFSSSECEFLRQLSEHVALAAHQTQLYVALQQAYDDLRQTQQAVMQQERLRALGQMASGIAHDINNAISPVALYTESLLETDETLSPRARKYLGTIQRAIEDVAQTVLRMREFYRQRESQLTLAPVQLNRLMQQVLDLSRARWSDMPQQRGIVDQDGDRSRGRAAGRHGSGKRDPRGVGQPHLQRGRRHARRRHADAADDCARRSGSGMSRSGSRCATPALAWTRTPGGAASSPFSPPRGSAAPAWAWPWSTASSSGTGRTSRSRASRARARPSA